MNRTQLTVVALLVSIAVNLLLLGGIGYRMLSLPEPGIRPFPPGVGWVTRDLSDARRSELAPLLDASEGEIR
ncbi:MAG: hypothetical protein RL120_03715, partial [Gammaproteobacteria bacterium]